MQHPKPALVVCREEDDGQRASLMQTRTILPCASEQRAVNVDNVFVTASAARAHGHVADPASG